MRTPYVPHLYGEKALARAVQIRGWLCAGVASSIPWPQEDVLVAYDGAEFLLRISQREGNQPAPSVCTPCPQDDYDSALARLLRFVSVLGWFHSGYVDVSGFAWSTVPMLYGGPRDTFTEILQGGRSGAFTCNYMPIVEDDNVRKALAFIREGRRLTHVHQAYSFLSFWKVLESQFDADARVQWIQANLGALDGRAATRVQELVAQGVPDIGAHLFHSCRSAVAHAHIGRDIIDPDIPVDRRQIRDDLVIIDALAARLMANDAKVPNARDLYRTRDRLTPWHHFLSPEALATLKAGGASRTPTDLGALEGATVAVRIWPNEALPALSQMTLHGVGSNDGEVVLRAHNALGTVFLFFVMDLANGRMFQALQSARITEQYGELTEDDLHAAQLYIHSAIGNGLTELVIDGVDPVQCEVIIPTNIIPRDPQEAADEAVAKFRQRKAERAAAAEADEQFERSKPCIA